MDFLQMLLGQQGAAQASQSVFNAEDPSQNQLLITGENQPVSAISEDPSADEIDQYLGMGLDNSEAILQRDRAFKSGEAVADHRGMFGLKGTLRDVIGLVGDAFLVQGGADAIYGPKRDQERMSDAIAGMSVNERAAIERVAGLNPAAAQKMLDDYLVRQQNETENMIKAQTATTSQQGKEFDIMTEVRDIAARILGGADTPERLEIAKNQIRTLAGRARLTMEDLGISPDMGLEEAYMYSRGDMRVNQQEMLPRRDRQLVISQQNADANTRRSNRPPAGRATTEATEAARIRGKINRGETLSPGDAATWKKYTEGTGGRRGSLLDRIPPPPGATAPARRFGPPRTNN